MIAAPDNPDDRAQEVPLQSEPASSIAMLVAAGLPLETGLRALSEEIPSRRLRRVLVRMSHELSAGRTPDEVLSGEGTGLPHYIRSLIRTGIQNGQLGTYLTEFLAVLRQRKRTAMELLLPLMNPVVLIPLTLCVVGIPLASITTQFQEIYNDFGIELPLVTRLLLNLGGLASLVVLLRIGLVLLGVFVSLWLLRFIVGAATWTRALQHVPLLGASSRMRGLTEFCSLLGLLVSGRVRLPDALEITAGALKDANLKAGALKLAGRVRDGDRLSEGAASLVHFPAELRNLFRWEDRGPAFGEILRQAGVVFHARSQVNLGLLLLLIPPLLLLIVGGIMAFTTVALFMPLITLLNELS